MTIVSPPIYIHRKSIPHERDALSLLLFSIIVYKKRDNIMTRTIALNTNKSVNAIFEL